MSEPELDFRVVVKPEWAEWLPDIFQRTLHGFPDFVLPESLLPPKDCANCLFSRDGWRGDGFCYMFPIEPTGDKCGQFKRVDYSQKSGV